jgi:CheY-like chemotaxis protein
MSDSAETAAVGEPPPAQRIELIGFSDLDTGRLRLFFERPSAAGQRVRVVESEGDLLIINAFSEAGEAARADPLETRPRIVIVERCLPDAHYYQVPRDAQLLFSLAQGVNRIRDGWTPPVGWSALPPGDTPAAEKRMPDRAETPALAAATAMPPSNAMTVAQADTEVDLSSLRFIVVDDSLFSREAVADALRRSKHSAVTAEGGAKAVALCRKHRFDVALIDFEMPGMNGPETIRALRRLGTASPRLMIMLTARDGVVDRLRGRFAGADAYLVKPARLSDLNAVISAHRARLAAAPL